MFPDVPNVQNVFKAFAKDNAKLEFSFTEGSEAQKLHEEVIKPALIQQGAEVKDGIAPRGDLEIRVQELVDQFELEG